MTGTTGDVQANVDFYAGTLGLRLVKRTVNHQDPSTLHLFYSTGDGQPGTLLTFFAWPDTARGRRGVGQVAEVSLAVPREAMGDWYQRLLASGVRFSGPRDEEGAPTISLEDPDGMPLKLVGVHARGAGSTRGTPPDGPDAREESSPNLPDAPSSLGLHAVTIWTDKPEDTGDVLTSLLGFERAGSDGTISTFVGTARVGSVVRLRDASGFWPAAGGVGTVHHVAFRGDPQTVMEGLREMAKRTMLGLSPLREHVYFRSVYFREPAGTLFEVATDGPGMTVDEAPAELGRAVVLPEDLERRREELETVLPSFALPGEPRPPRRDLGWVHRHVAGRDDRTLLLLHGIGGDETTLLPLARQASAGSHLLSVRGPVTTSGRPAFVGLDGDGEPDTAALALAADELATFAAEAAALYGLEAAGMTLVGHQDGADLALVALALHPRAFAGAALLRPGLRPAQPPRGELDGKRVLVVLGSDDPALAQGESAAAYLTSAGADVEVVRVPLGSILWDMDTEALREWLDDRK